MILFTRHWNSWSCLHFFLLCTVYLMFRFDCHQHSIRNTSSNGFSLGLLIMICLAWRCPKRLRKENCSKSFQISICRVWTGIVLGNLFAGFLQMMWPLPLPCMHFLHGLLRYNCWRDPSFHLSCRCVSAATSRYTNIGVIQFNHYLYVFL